MEIPIGFEVGGVHFYLYPVTLGRAYLISREREGMAENLKEVFDISSEKEKLDYRMSLCRILALQTFKNPEQIFDVKKLEKRVNFFYNNIDSEGLFCLYDMIMDSMKDSSLYIKSYGLDLDKKALLRIAKLKGDSGSISFGGKTAYGSFISPACEKYGWSIRYVVWGISLTNLEMLLADAQTSVYLTKDERKKLKLSTDRTVIDANDPANIEQMRMILKGN